VKRVVWTGVGIVLSVAAAATQQPTRKFELVSIRAVPANAAPVMRDQDFTPFQPGGRFVDSRTNLAFLIATAYDVDNPGTRLLGMPSWQGKGYAISAKAADDFPVLSPEADRDQVRIMLRELLADRFHLRLHTELREETVLKMSIDPAGFQLKEAAAPMPPEREGRVNAALGDSGGRMIATKATMAGLAATVGLFLRQEVVDETGLKGYYDFDIRWSAPLVPGAPPPSPRLGADGIDLLLSTLKEKFGLRFSRGTGRVKYWIVDHVEQPAED
jgi:uncharacterized protein (TIGR03435 family)